MQAYIGVLRECPGYRLLFAARAVSLFGDWFSLIAVVALLRDIRGSDPRALSVILILKLLPIFFAGPLAGVVADRFSRKTIMVVTDLLRVALVLALLAVPALPGPILWVYGLVLFQVVASAFFEPARAAALPQLVPERHLAAANALGAIIWSAMFTLGAALGGVVTDLVGWKVALVIDAGTYVLSAALVYRIVLPRREKRARGPVGWMTLTGTRDFVDGLAFVAKRRDVATVLFLKAGWGIAGALTLFLTLFGERVYAIGGRPDLGVAVLYVARALGTGIGPVLARRLVPDEGLVSMRRLLTVCMLWPALWYGVFSFAQRADVAAACVLLAHFGGSTLWVYSTVLLQKMVPNRFLGRVMSTDLGLATLVISISTWIYGLLADAPGADLRLLVRWMSISLLVPTLIWWVAAKTWLRPQS